MSLIDQWIRAEEDREQAAQDVEALPERVRDQLFLAVMAAMDHLEPKSPLYNRLLDVGASIAKYRIGYRHK